MHLPHLWVTVPVLLERVVASSSRHSDPQLPFIDPSSTPSSDEKVSVMMYVMSRCSDARICEGVFEDVFRTKGIKDKVDFDLKIVAHLNHSDPLGVTCPHGPLECFGNAHNLCLQEHLPLADFYATLACENFATPFPGKIGQVPFIRQCAETAKIDWWKSGVGRCIQGKHAEKDDGKKAADKGRLGKEARKLLIESVAQTEKRGVHKSCTIEIDSTLRKDGKRICVIDGGKWKGCDDGHTAADFVRVIEEEWGALQPKKLDWRE